jgi:outer membrane lipoprotein-sorting protein
MRTTLAALLVVPTFVAPCLAAPPDVQALVKRMKAALEPAKPGVRRLTFTLTQENETVQVTVGEARKQVGGGSRILLVTLAPASAQGTAYLVQEGGPGQDKEWFYLPYVRRVRELVSPEAYSAFLNSDFTYADLGFVSTGATYTFVGEGSQQGVKTYQIQGVPKESWYYSRWVTTINAETGMPIVREIYDSANQLWKRQRWEQATVVDGVPLPSAISMEDLQAKSRTDIRLAGADYDVTLADDLFDPDNLPAAGAAKVWASVGK